MPQFKSMASSGDKDLRQSQFGTDLSRKGFKSWIGDAGRNGCNLIHSGGLQISFLTFKPRGPFALALAACLL
jgi:hypothetical protein